MPPTLSTTVPDDATRAAVLGLAAEVEGSEGAPPLSDQTISQLESPDVQHLLVHADDRLLGYGQLDGAGFELAVHGSDTDATAGLLLDAAGASTPDALLVWSHGRRSALIEVLERRGFARERELHQLRRPFGPAAPLPADPPLADGVAVRPFVAGSDDDAWLALNAAAFVQHPEQGRWTARDLAARIAEPWFDPAGFLLAEHAGELLGFHWTKIHPDGLGEVYVLGVAPAAQGLGLGRALLIRGLRLLRDHGCPQVLLYVDGDNPGALHLYERDGFTRYDLDIQWRSA